MTKIFLLLFLIGLSAKAENILLIGDSHSCGSFGKNVVGRLSEQGNFVTLYCAVSSAPIHWVEGKNPSGQICQTMNSNHQTLQPCEPKGKMPALKDLLKVHKNSKVISALGTNSLMSSKADSSYQTMANQIKASGQSCVWVGPPHVSPQQSKGFPQGRVALLESHLDSFYESLKVSVKNDCALLDSRNVTAAGKTASQTVDGVHRTPEAGLAWAEFVAPDKSKKANATQDLSGAR